MEENHDRDPITGCSRGGAARAAPADLSTFDGLEPGQSFVLINDHDPKPLFYQFQAEREGRLRREYLATGPED